MTGTAANIENSPHKFFEISAKDGYKKTKLGWIPEEWEVIKLSELTSKIGSGVTPKGGSEVYTKNGHPFIRSQNVGWGNLLLDDIAHIPEEIHQEMSSTALKMNDVLLNITGASIGRSTVVTKEIEDGNVNQHVCIIRPEHSKIDFIYLNSFLISWNGQKQVESFQAGGNRQGLNFHQIGLFKIPLPPLPEQKKIAEILSTWDRSIETLEQLIAKKEELKRGLMQELLTPNGFDDWNEVKLGDLGTFSKGKGVSKSEVQETGLPAVRYGELYTNHHLIIKEFNSFISHESAEQSMRIHKGDILFAGSGETAEEIGKCVVFNNNFEAYAGGDIVILRPKNVDPVYLSYYLNSTAAIKQKSRLGQGHSVVHIYSRNLKQIKVLLPDIEQQIRIVKIYTTLENEIELLKDQKMMYEVQKKGLMQQLLTGKMIVKTEMI